MEPLSEVARWLRVEGCFAPSMEAILTGLVDGVQAAGLPLLRCGLHLHILHPQLVAVSLHWWRGGEVTRVERPRYPGWESDGYKASPIAKVTENGVAIRRKVDAGDFPILLDLAAAGGTDYYVQPLLFGDRSVGASVTWCTDRPGGFTDAEIAALDALAVELSVHCELRVMRGLASTILDTYIGRTAGRRVLAGTIQRGTGELLEAVVWYCDLRGFTGRSEAGPQGAVIALLNGYFEAMAGAVQEHGGEVLKFIGDGMLAIFPITGGALGDACRRALAASAVARARMTALDAQVQAEGGSPVEYGIALHVGTVTYGNIGAPDRLDFTVIGPAVNQAARVEGLCRVLGRSVLLTTAVAEHADGQVERLGTFPLRGIEEPQDVWGLLG